MICTIVRGEILFGIARLPVGRRRSELEETGHRFLAAFRCEPIPERATGYYADLKVARQQRGLSLDENDLWVAATALALGTTLVSRDGDFAEIPGLPVVALQAQRTKHSQRRFADMWRASAPVTPAFGMLSPVTLESAWEPESGSMRRAVQVVG